MGKEETRNVIQLGNSISAAFSRLLATQGWEDWVTHPTN